MMNAAIKKLIEETMRKKRLSVHGLANELRVSRQTVYDWMNGEYIPTITTVRKIRSLGGWQRSFGISLYLIISG
jgi:predicted transcriptional regulator